MAIRVSNETENRTCSGKDGFAFKRWFPALNIFVGDLLIARANGFDCEFVQHAKNLRGDPIRGASKSAQALSREGLWPTERQASKDANHQSLKLFVSLPPWKNDLIKPPRKVCVASNRFTSVGNTETHQ